MRESSGLYGLSAVIFTCLLTAPAEAARPSAGFAARMEAATLTGASIPGIVMLEAQLDVDQLERDMARLGIRTRASRHEYVLTRARDLAASTQPLLLTALQQERAAGSVLDFTPLWITNAIAVDAKATAWAHILSLPGIARVEENFDVEIREGELQAGSVEHGRASGSPTLGGGPPIAHEDNLNCVNVQAAWNQGLTGAGRLVCSFDTGADPTHPAFASRWRGLDPGVRWDWAWRDPYNATQYPFDGGWHGTGTLSLVCGAPPDTTPIGVAYEAKWIAARTCCPPFNVQKVIENYQWAADPDSNLTTIDDVPDVINNSWGTVQDCDQSFWNAIDVVEAAGIVNVISVDNSGPNPASVNSPESRSTDVYRNFSVGNVDPHTAGYPIVNSSGRGPSPCDFFSIKPELTAPGFLVRIAYPNFQYALGAGTSFAAPHVSGAVALLRQLNPNLTVNQIKEALMVSAYDRGTTGEDNTYGWGILDIGAAVQYAKTTWPLEPAPRNLVGQVVFETSVLLNWALPSGVFPGNPLTGFRVYRRANQDPYSGPPIAELPFFPASYTDSLLADGLYHYQVTAIYQNGGESLPSNEVGESIEAQVDVEAGATPARLDLRLLPNPSRGATQILCALPTAGRLTVTIYAATGARVRRLLDGEGSAPGIRALAWDGRDDAGRPVPNGAYFVTMANGQATRQAHLTLVR